MRVVFIIVLIVALIGAGFFYIMGVSITQSESFSEGLTAITSAPDGSVVIAQNHHIYILSSDGAIEIKFGRRRPSRQA